MNEEKQLDDVLDGEDVTPEEPIEEGNNDPEDSGAGDDKGKAQPNEADTLKARITELENEVAGEKGKHTDKDALIGKLLSDLGYEDLDAYHADKAGKSKADYIKSRDDEITLAEAKKLVEANKYAKMAADDLATLKSRGLIDSTVNDIRDIGSREVVRRFAQLRDLGLSTEEAYRAAAGTTVDERIERGAKRAASGKEHLTTPKSRGASGNGSVMSERQKAEYREWLGTNDDAAIESAWRRAQGKA